MKKNTLKIIITTILSISTLVVFSQDSTFVSSVGNKDRIAVDLPAFKYARVDSSADFKHFKADAETNIINNHKTIDWLKSHKTKGDNQAKAKYRDQVAVLEDKNDEMAIKIAVSEMVSTRNWVSFKRDFKKEMAELTAALKEISNNNN